ncbi:hypothetical protein [Streptomyces sp. NPDC059850]|uniref:hypothetical protein n=1 Tax=Streptomyces sp. NPDC059850 TaxID=3346970 RepID=UPI003664A2A8
MATAAVRIVTDLATGAVTAVGTEVGRTVSVLVRERLGGSADGQAALSAVDDRPQDPEAVTGLRDAVRAAMAADGEFAARLNAALAGPPPPPPDAAPRQVVGSVTIDGGARVRRTQISLGPMTFNNTPSGRAALTALSVVMAVLLAFAAYGGVRLIAADDGPGATTWEQGGPGAQWDAGSGTGAPDPDPGGPGSEGTPASGSPAAEKLVPLADAAAVESVLPDADGSSLPAGWTQSSAPRVGASSRGDGSTFTGRVKYIPGDGGGIEFHVVAYPSVEKARAGYAAMAPPRSAEVKSLTMPSAGDESRAYSSPQKQSFGDSGLTMDRDVSVTMVRTGSVVTVIAKIDDSALLDSLTPMMAERARQAQQA